MISKALSLTSKASSLKDIHSHWAKDSINACANAGIIQGYKDSTFRPNNPATRAETAKMIAEMLDKK